MPPQRRVFSRALQAEKLKARYSAVTYGLGFQIADTLFTLKFIDFLLDFYHRRSKPTLSLTLFVSSVVKAVIGL